MLAHTLVYGFVNSVILVLVALGFNLTFGISGVANFAYGALYIMSALICWVFFNAIGLPYILAVLLAKPAPQLGASVGDRELRLREIGDRGELTSRRHGPHRGSFLPQSNAP